MISGFSLEELQELDPQLLRAVIREKAHHTVEFPLYQALFADGRLSPRVGNSLAQLLAVWAERQLPEHHADIHWSYTLLRVVEEAKAKEKVTVDEDPLIPLQEREREVVEHLIRTRRSIRVWNDKPVARELVEKVIEAGLWAPHACNLQTIRVVVLEGEEGQQLFRSGEITDWQVCIAVGQDMRPYECFTASVPVYNQDLDCGAAVQNMLLMAHALGLGAVWGTFVGEEVEAISQHYNLPGYIRLRTYIALGWPAQTSLAPGRISLEDAILGESSRE